MKRLGLAELEESLEWLEQVETEHITQDALARSVGLTQSQVSRRLAMARRAREMAQEREPRLHVNFLLPRGGKLLSEATCQDVHPEGPIEPGSNQCCSVGHEYGRDMDLVGLRRDESPAVGGKIYDPPKGLKGGKS